MGFAFAGEQPFAQQTLGALQYAALQEIRLMRHQNVANPFGTIHQIGILAR